MDKPKAIGTEITVRISLAFQDAPDVHTLLAMTPVRERGKLVRLALQHYITAQGHPSGNVETQIEAISHWLRNRSAQSTAESTSSTTASASNHSAQSIKNLDQKIDPSILTNEQRVEHPQEPTKKDENVSASMARWLMG